MKYKKGDVPDMLIFLITIFILGIGLFILAFVIPQISDGLNLAGLNSTSEGADAIEGIENMGISTMQTGFLLLFAGLIMGTLITSFFIRTHPIFMFMYILFLILTAFIGTYLGNAYQQITQIPIFAETLASQTMINAIMNNVVEITIAVGVLSIIVVFAKFSSFGRATQDI